MAEKSIHGIFKHIFVLWVFLKFVMAMYVSNASDLPATLPVASLGHTEVGRFSCYAFSVISELSFASSL